MRRQRWPSVRPCEWDAAWRLSRDSRLTVCVPCYYRLTEFDSRVTPCNFRASPVSHMTLFTPIYSHATPINSHVPLPHRRVSCLSTGRCHCSWLPAGRRRVMSPPRRSSTSGRGKSSSFYRYHIPPPRFMVEVPYAAAATFLLPDFWKR